MRKFLFFIILTFTACGQSRTKVIVDTFASGKPKNIRYFNSKADSKEVFILTHKDGKGTASKPLTFDEEGYYEDGKKHIECYQILNSNNNFKLDGIFKEWYDNGQLKFIATFKNGLTVGKWQQFDKKGKLIEESDKSFSITIGE